MQKALLWLGLLSCMISGYSVAAPSASQMIYVETRFLSPKIKPGSFEASARKVWRSGDGLLRLEEAPDPKQKIWGVVIINEPNVWMWNRFDDTAKHIVDPGPSFVAHMAVFTGEHSALLQKLEIGREKEFFEANHATRLPDEVISGVKCEVRFAKVEDATLHLYLRKSNKSPFQISISSPRNVYAVRYETYDTGVPLSVSLFSIPKGLKITKSN